MAQDLEVKLLIDTKQFQTAMRTLAGNADTTVKGIESAFKSLDVEIDAKTAGQAFNEVNAAARKSVDEQKAALAALTASGKKGSAEYKAVKDELLKSKAAADKLADAVDDVDKEIGDAAKGAGTFSQVFGGAFLGNVAANAVGTITNAAGAALEEYRKLDTNINNIGTLGVEAAGQSLDRYQDLIVNLSRTVPDEASNIAAGVYNAISAGVTGSEQEIVGFVETASRVAVAGLSDTNTAVNALTSVTNAYASSQLSAETASNVFFGAIKAGKTSFEELNAGMAQVIPAASAAGVSFEEVSASIAQLTTVGIPTSQATTQIRSAIIELQKPSAPLAAALAKIGLNASNMAEELAKPTSEGGGLINIMQRLEESAKASGQSLTQIFSSSEAASAGLSLTGQNAENALKILDDVQTAAVSGAADSAFEAASKSIDVQIGLLKNQITAVFTDIFDSASSSLVPVIRQFAEDFLPRLVAAFNNIKDAIAPTLGVLATTVGAILGGAFIVLLNVVEKLGEGLQTIQPIIPLLVAGFAAWAIATNASTIATKLAAAQQAIFNAVAAANPIGATIVVVLAAVAAYAALADALTDSAEEQLEAAEAQKEITEQRIKDNQASKETTKNTQALVKEFEKLATSTERTAEDEKRLQEIQRELDQQYPDLIDQTKSFSENLDGVAEIGKRAGSEMANLTKQGEALATQLRESEKAIASAQRKVAVTELRDVLNTDLLSNAFRILGDQSGAKFRVSFGKSLGNFEKALFGAKTEAELDKGLAAILEFVNANAKALDDADKELELRNAITKAYQASRDALKSYGLIKDEVNKPPTDDGAPDADAINNANAATKKSAEDVIKLKKEELQLEQEKLENRLEQQRQAELQIAIEEGRSSLSTEQQIKLNNEELAGRRAIVELAENLLEVQRNAAGQVVELGIASGIKAEDREAVRQELISLVSGYGADVQSVVVDNLKLGAADLSTLGADAKRIIEEARKQVKEGAEQAIELQITVAEFESQSAEQIAKAKVAAAEIDSAIETALAAGDTKRAAQLRKDAEKYREYIEQLEADRSEGISKARAANLEREIALIEDAAERQYKQDLLDLERRAAEELSQAGLTVEQRLILERRFAREREAIETDYYRQANANLFELGEAIGAAFQSAFTAIEVDQEALDNISAAEDAELASLRRREGNYKDYVDNLNNLDRERREVYEAADIAFTERLAGSFENISGALNAKTDEIITNFQTQAEAGEISYELIAAAAGTQFLSVAATAEDAGDAVLQTLLQTASRAIDIYIPQIIAAFTSILGPFGIPAAFAAIGLVKGLLSAASSGFKEGGYTGDIGINDVAGAVHGREFVFDHQKTAQYRGLFDFIHAGGDPANYYNTGGEVTRDGAGAIVRKLDSLERTTRALGVRIERRTSVGVQGTLTADTNQLTATLGTVSENQINRG